MSKIQRPRAGGSYVRDAKTGKLERRQFTKPEAAQPAPPAKQAAPAAAPEAKEA